MRIQAKKRLMTLKVVFYGPGQSGKTTNLQVLHDEVPETKRGELITLDTESERTLFFDYFPAMIGKVGGFAVRVEFFTVPGQSFYSATRRAVLEGADGIVFVADSQRSREMANQLSRDDLEEQLRSLGRNLDDIPHVYQWNKRDVAQPLALADLEATLNPEGAPSVPAIASRGRGVRQAQALVIRQVLARLRHREVRSRLTAPASRAQGQNAPRASESQAR